MKTLYAQVAGEARPIDIIGPQDSMEHALEDIDFHPGPLAVDVETTGLDTFSSSFRLRTVQVATKEKAWNFQMELLPRVKWDALGKLLRDRPVLMAHNASYDLLVLDRFGILDLELAYAKMVDTYLLAHLLDPRSKQDGSSGHQLEALASHYLGEDAYKYKAELMDVFRANGWTSGAKADMGLGYASVDIHEPAYLRYGGVDVLLTCWLYDALRPLIVSRGFTELSDFEHEVSLSCARMERRGFLVDQDYAPKLAEMLTEKAETGRRTAATYGVENVNSTAQVSEALLALGATLTAKTKTKKWKVDKDVLKGLVRANEGQPIGLLADAVMDAKNAQGYRVKYVDKVMASLGADGRCHPSIHSLQARTARMAISDPPLHQIPSGDHLIRALFIASPGKLIVSSDYDQIELRIMGGLANDEAILQAVEDGVDLHDLTASRIGIDRRLAKTANFLIGYGGGAGKLAVSAGISQHEAKKALAGWWRSYPGVKKYKNRLIGKTRQGRYPVVTATGRELPLDRQRIYAGLNYVIQSTARDVLAQAILDVKKAGLEDGLLIPVHDELVAEAPADSAEEYARELGKVMSMSILNTTLSASGEVYGPSWGSGYK